MSTAANPVPVRQCARAHLTTIKTNNDNNNNNNNNNNDNNYNKFSNLIG